jgi:hypothetical protein
MKMLSNGLYARDIRAFEDVMNDEDFRALNEIVDEKIKDLQEVKGDNFELIADEYFQQIRNSEDILNETIKYVLEAKRINRDKLLNLLRSAMNALEDY